MRRNMDKILTQSLRLLGVFLLLLQTISTEKAGDSSKRPQLSVNAEPQKGKTPVFSTTDWAIIGGTGAFPVLVFIVTVLVGICRVRQEEKQLQDKIKKREAEKQNEENLSVAPAPAHRM